MAAKTTTQLDITYLKAKNEITDEQLDSKIHEDTFYELAGHLGSFELYAGVPGFGFNKAKIADLKAVADKLDNQHAMSEALKEWSGMIQCTFTYRFLLEILIKLEKGSIADTVCKIANSTRPQQNIGPLLKTETNEIKLSSTVSIADEVNEFQKRFVVLRLTALKEVTENEISVTNFRQVLITQPDSIKYQHKCFVMANFFLFKNAESIEFIFVHLNYYLSFIDFSLLEHIIEYFGSEQLKNDMSCYAQDMMHFRKTTTISNALQYLSNDNIVPEDFSCFEVKFDKNIETATLEELNEYRKKYADNFLLSQLALSLFKVKKGSLLVIWLVPTALKTYMGNLVQEKLYAFLSSSNILEISLEGRYLYIHVPSMSIKPDSQLAVRSAGYNVFRKYKGILESHVDKKFNDVVDGFYNEEILTEQQKTNAQDTSKKRSERIANIKRIMREKCQESDTTFEAILRALWSIEGVDVKKITNDFETEKKKSVSKPKPKSSKKASKTMHSSPISVQKDPQPAPDRGGIINPPSFIDDFPRSGDHLSTIPGSPSLNIQHDNEDDDQPPIDTEVVPSYSTSHTALAEPRLNSESYEEPCQSSTREFTGIQATSNHPTKKEVVTEKQILKRRMSDDHGSTYPKPNDEMDAIRKLHISMIELKTLLHAEHIDDEEYKEKYKEKWLAVEKSSIHLTTIYRDNIQKVKDKMQKVKQQAEEEKEYLLKEFKMLGAAESELKKKIQQKKAEKQQNNQEIQELMASLEKAKNEMKSTLYVKQYTELEEKKGIVDKAIDSIRSRTPQDNKTQYKRTLSTSMEQVLALKDLPSTDIGFE